jgi:hypothetical protein
MVSVLASARVRAPVSKAVEGTSEACNLALFAKSRLRRFPSSFAALPAILWQLVARVRSPRSRFTEPATRVSGSVPSGSIFQASRKRRLGALGRVSRRAPQGLFPPGFGRLRSFASCPHVAFTVAESIVIHPIDGGCRKTSGSCSQARSIASGLHASLGRRPSSSISIVEPRRFSVRLSGRIDFETVF